MADTDYPMEISTLTPTIVHIDLTDSEPEDDGPRDQDAQDIDVDLTDAGQKNGEPRKQDVENIDVDLTGAEPEVQEIRESGLDKVNVDLTDSGPEDEEHQEPVVEQIEVDLTEVGPDVEENREPPAERNEVDLTGKPVESNEVELIDSGPEDEDPQEPDAKRHKVDLADAEPENGAPQEPGVETIEVDLTDSGPEDDHPPVKDVSKVKEIAAKIRKPLRQKQIKSISGPKIERFRFLLKQGYPFRQAFLGSCKRIHFEAVAKSVVLAVAERRSQQDPWLSKQLKEKGESPYFTMFMKSFLALLEQGETLDDAWTLARRETDTRTVVQTQAVRCDPKTFEGKARFIICNTNHPEAGITSEEFQLILAEMKKNLDKITDIRYIPHLVECMLVPGTGYILAICCDDITIRWVRLTLKWMTLWPGASLCMVREKKFLESCFMTLSVPDIARTNGQITKFLKEQNRPLPLDKWSMLTAEPLDKEKVKKLTFLIPLKDRDGLQARNFSLNYQQHKLKLATPEDRTKIGKRALFRGNFYAAEMTTEAIFQTIANENDIAVTNEWKQLHRNNTKVKTRLCFYVDAASAEVIRAADNKISFKFEWVKLSHLARVSEV